MSKKIIEGHFPNLDAEELAKKNNRAYKLQQEPTRESQSEKVDMLSKAVFDVQLIKLLTKKLEYEALKNVHAYYCGHGIRKLNHVFQLCTVHDGAIRDSSVLLEWNSNKEFFNFFSQQSDFTMSGACPSIPEIYTSNHLDWCNQTITSKRIKSFVMSTE